MKNNLCGFLLINRSKKISLIERFKLLEVYLREFVRTLMSQNCDLKSLMILTEEFDHGSD